MSTNPNESPETASDAKVPRQKGFRVTLVEILAVLGTIAILVALLLPAVRTAREPARRMQCGNNLKQIALALQNYHDVYNSFPPAYTVDANGKPLHSWRTLILPFNEQKALYDKIDLSKPWDDPANREANKARVPSYDCPSTEYPTGHTAYLAVVAPNGCFNGSEARTIAEITDATASTLLVIEVDAEHAVPWMSPQDASEQLILSLGKAERRPHPSGFQAAFVDGHVQLLLGDISAATLRALISINGNDVVDEY
jgi:prepilin-type processing-associated H-X9-DG protein